MTGVWGLAALWLRLALVAGLLSIWFLISTALSEIVVGTIARLITGAAIGSTVLGTDESWVKFVSGIVAIILTFLAGAQLDPVVFKLKWKEAAAVGLASFFFPFLGYAAATSTTSVAVVHIPTVIANASYLPHHLLPEAESERASDEPGEVTQLQPVTRRAA
jgi:Kef-type K+ transport system membrane component KefB